MSKQLVISVAGLCVLTRWQDSGRTLVDVNLARLSNPPHTPWILFQDANGRMRPLEGVRPGFVYRFGLGDGPGVTFYENGFAGPTPTPSNRDDWRWMPHLTEIQGVSLKANYESLVTRVLRLDRGRIEARFVAGDEQVMMEVREGPPITPRAFADQALVVIDVDADALEIQKQPIGNTGAPWTVVETLRWGNLTTLSMSIENYPPSGTGNKAAALHFRHYWPFCDRVTDPNAYLAAVGSVRLRLDDHEGGHGGHDHGDGDARMMAGPSTGRCSITTFP